MHAKWKKSTAFTTKMNFDFNRFTVNLKMGGLQEKAIITNEMQGHVFMIPMDPCS